MGAKLREHFLQRLRLRDRSCTAVGGSMLLRILGLATTMMIACGLAAGAEQTPPLAQSPRLSRTQVVFGWGGYLWSVAREGGEARQLTTGGHESAPVFSPDGNWIAFTGQYDGNVDAFVMPASGGEPRRLTWHPGADEPVGWTA